MSLYADLATDVNNALSSELGQVVTITYNTIGTYDPTLGQAATTTRTATSYAVLLNYRDEVVEIAGTSIVAGDKRCLLSAYKTTQPNINDTILANGVVYTVKAVKATNPANTPLVYDLLLRSS